jgi:hypothetical protein
MKLRLPAQTLAEHAKLQWLKPRGLPQKKHHL